MTKKKYLNLCRLSTDNYLQLEKKFFEFANIIYIYDNWTSKKKIYTMELANLHNSICSAIEESVKLLLLNPKNSLINEFIETHEFPDKKTKNEMVLKLNSEKLDNIKFNWILNFKNFRKQLNIFSEKVRLIKPPLQLYFPENFGKKNIKPEWYGIYEDVKHNFFSKYSKAKFDIVFDSLAAYYLIARILAHEATFIINPKFQNGYYPWYEANIKIDTATMSGAPKHYIAKFESNNFDKLILQPLQYNF